MNSNVKLGRLYGVPVGLHWSWFLIFILLSWSLANGVYAPQFPTQSPALHWGLGVTTSVLLFASVLAHEFGHALVSIRNGIPVERITLFIFGGVAQISQEPQSPGVEFRIAIAGPLVSLALAIIFGLFWLVASSVPVLVTGARWLAEINLTLVVFNMIPAFPLDGGRVLRSVMWAWKKDYLKATRMEFRTCLFLPVSSLSAVETFPMEPGWLLLVGSCITPRRLRASTRKITPSWRTCAPTR